MLEKFEDVYKCDSITINVTNNCNLSCIYCFEHNKQPEMMDSKTAIDIVDKAYSSRNKESHGKFMLNFFGGEPFLNWKCMKDVIDHCNEKGYEIFYGVTTNLTIITDEIMEYIDDNELHLLVSVDGKKEIHDKNRSNSYDIVSDNIKKLIDNGLGIFVEVRMTILPEDIDKAIDGVKEFLDMGFTNIAPCPVTDTEWNEEQLKGLEKYMEDLMELYVTKLNDDNSTENFSIKNTDEILLNVLEPDVYTPQMCPIGSTRWCAFDINGDIYPCHQLPTSEKEHKEDQKIGNIYTGVDRSMLTGGVNPAKYVKEECDTCIGRSICASGCPEENIRQTGDVDTPSDAYCAVKRAMVKAVKKYQHKFITATNVRSRTLNVLIENLKIKDYIDTVFKNIDVNDELTFTVSLAHVDAMIKNLGEENIIGSFKDYFTNAIIDKSAKVLAAQGVEDLYLSQIKPEDAVVTKVIEEEV